MNAQVYEVLALAMRYFFTFLGIIIVWRAFSWLHKDRKIRHRRLKQLPDAGTIGIFTVLEGSRHLQPGDVIPVPHEGVLGYLRTCDIVVPVDDVAKLHLDFTFVNGKGLYIHPLRGCEAVVDGISITSRRQSKQHPMLHGSILEIGQAVLQLGVFAGLNVQEVPMHAVCREYQADEAFIPEPQQPYAPPYQQPQIPLYQQSPFAPPYSPVNPQQQGGGDDAP